MADPNSGASATRPAEGGLGTGTPANVDIHKLGQKDRPEEAWGEPGDPEATFSSDHARRSVPTEASQGRKTRTANKDIVSRRG